MKSSTPQGLHSLRSMEHAEEGPPPSSTQRRVCQSTFGTRQAASRESFHALAAQEAGDESLPNMRRERGAEHELIKAPSPKVAQEAFVGKRR